MKKLVLITAILTISCSAMAQLFPVLGTVGTTKSGDASIAAGAAIYTGDSGIAAGGIRGTYCPVEDLLLIGDLALTRTAFGDESDYAQGVGIAAQFSFAKVESLLVDVAVRVGYCAYDITLPVNSSSINAMVLMSGESETVKGLAAYGGLGVAYWEENCLGASLLVNLGVRYIIPQVDRLSICGEVSYVSGNVDMDAGLGLSAAYSF